jgi:hypothetical protein
VFDQLVHTPCAAQGLGDIADGVELVVSDRGSRAVQAVRMPDRGLLALAHAFRRCSISRRTFGGTRLVMSRANTSSADDRPPTMSWN